MRSVSKELWSCIIPMAIGILFLLPMAYYCGVLEASVNSAASNAPFVYVMAVTIGSPLIMVVFWLSSRRG